MSSAKMDEPIQMQFGMVSQVDPENHLLDQGHISATWRIRLNVSVRRQGSLMSNYIDHLTETLTAILCTPTGGKVITLPPGGKRSIVVSMSVCLSACIFQKPHPNFTKFSVHYLWPCLGVPLTTMQYVIYFRFVDDIMTALFIIVKLCCTKPLSVTSLFFYY